MKTSLLKSILIGALFTSAPAFALNKFDCLRDLMPVTDIGYFQTKRVGFEKPYLVGTNFLVFPEVTKEDLTGFYLYDRTGAWYFDAVEWIENNKTQAKSLAEVSESRNRILYQLVVQPKGLETVTIYYMPGFNARLTTADGPVALGASILPVVGAMVSRPNRSQDVYQDPLAVPETQLKEWLHKNSTGRKPATAEDIEIVRRISRLKTRKAKSHEDLWRPLNNELGLRREWVQSHNLDDQTYRKFSLALSRSCKE